MKPFNLTQVSFSMVKATLVCLTVKKVPDGHVWAS